jgi:hypothetical protein
MTMTSTSTSFDPSQAIRFDLAAGSVALADGSDRADAAGVGAAVVPANALSALVSAVARSGAAEAAFAAWGEALGQRAKHRLGDVGQASPEAVLEHVGGEIALAGLGVLGFERWGQALVLTVTGGALGPSGDEALSFILRALLATATGKPIFTVQLGRAAGETDPLRILVTGERGAERALALLAEGASWGLVLAGLHTTPAPAARLPADSRPRMSANGLVIQKLEGLLARVQQRAQAPRATHAAPAAVAVVANEADAHATTTPSTNTNTTAELVDRHEAPTTAPPPPEVAVQVEGILAAAAPPPVFEPEHAAASEEAGSVEVDEPMLIPVEESASDGDLPVVEGVATADPQSDEAGRFVPPDVGAQTDGARTAPPPAPEAAVLTPAELSFADAPASQPAPVAVAAPVDEPAAAPASPPAVSTATVHDAAGAAAAAAFAIADADTADAPADGEAVQAGSVVEVPVVREAPSTPAPAPEAAALDPQTEEPEAPPATPPLELVEAAAKAALETRATDPGTNTSANAEAEAEPVPSSSRRVRGGTIPPVAAAPDFADDTTEQEAERTDADGPHEESGAHAIPERPVGELALQIAGTTVTRGPVPAAAQRAVASFASAAAPATAPASFGDWLDASLRLG